MRCISCKAITLVGALIVLGSASDAAAQVHDGAPEGSTVPSSSRSELEAAASTAQVNWISCIQDQALRLTLRAVDAGTSPPSAASVFSACEDAEASFERAALAASGATESPEARQARRLSQEASVAGLISRTYADYNRQ